jgi:hypothetical protein
MPRRFAITLRHVRSVLGFLTLLIVSAALFGSLACTVGNASKISKNDVEKLDAAMAQIPKLTNDYQLGMSRCLDQTDIETCGKRLNKKLETGFRSIASTFEQVSLNADGSCQKALRSVANDFLALATVLEKNVNPPFGSARMRSDTSASVKACNIS